MPSSGILIRIKYIYLYVSHIICNNIVATQLAPNIQYLNFISAVMEAIPTIVCDTLYAMGLHDQTPSWKIMDNKGRITVVLHWEREEFQAISGPSRQSSTSTIASGGPRLLGAHTRSLSQVHIYTGM